MKKISTFLTPIFLLFTILLSGCGNTNIDSASSVISAEDYAANLDKIQAEEKAIKSEIKAQLLDSNFPPQIKLLSILTNSCSLYVSYEDSKDTFLEQCYFALPIIKNVLNENQNDSTSITITAINNNDDPVLVLTYKSDEDISVNNFMDKENGNTKYSYAQLDVLKLANASDSVPNKNLKGRGHSDVDRSEPEYVGVAGYVVVSYEQEYELERTDTFTETPWLVPTFSENNKTLNHKTEVIVKSQALKHEGYGNYSGQLTVEIIDTKEEVVIDVSNFITKPYWLYPDLEDASKIGYFIAEYHQKSSYYPVDCDNKKVTLEDGMKVLVVGSAGALTGSNKPDTIIYPIKALVYKNWKYGYGESDVYFNPKDLTLIY